VGVKAWDNEGEVFWKVLFFEFGQGIASLEILFRKKNSYVDLKRNGFEERTGVEQTNSPSPKPELRLADGPQCAR